VTIVCDEGDDCCLLQNNRHLRQILIKQCSVTFYKFLFLLS